MRSRGSGLRVDKPQVRIAIGIRVRTAIADKNDLPSVRRPRGILVVEVPACQLPGLSVSNVQNVHVNAILMVERES